MSYQFEYILSLVLEDSDLCREYLGPQDLVLDALEAVTLESLVRRVHATLHPLEQPQLNNSHKMLDEYERQVTSQSSRRLFLLLAEEIFFEY